MSWSTAIHRSAGIAPPALVTALNAAVDIILAAVSLLMQAVAFVMDIISASETTPRAKDRITAWRQLAA